MRQVHITERFQRNLVKWQNERKTRLAVTSRTFQFVSESGQLSLSGLGLMTPKTCAMLVYFVPYTTEITTITATNEGSFPNQWYTGSFGDCDQWNMFVIRKLIDLEEQKANSHLRSLLLLQLGQLPHPQARLRLHSGSVRLRFMSFPKHDA